ncbi:MAG: sodium-dependent transporter [Candidatus Thioglobus sp.]|nr:sodium-dependent transporter [Candidatus Thioglobus sp.]
MKSQPQWSNRSVFLLAAVGSAVGLGNIWKFPYIVGENGGGAFILVYLFCIALVGIPVLIAEILIGKTAQANPVSAFENLAGKFKASRFWVIFGFIGIITGFLILSFYSVVAGWALEYLAVFLQNDLAGAAPEQVKNHFADLLKSPSQLLFWHSIFMLLTILIVAKGVNQGIEKVISLAMPALFLILIILVIYASQQAGFSEALAYLFTPDFSLISTETTLIALGHAFFTLSLGMGAMMVYGSYLSKNTAVVRLSLSIALIDTLVALLAGLAIFPLIFTYGLEPSSGPSLLFISLPNALLALPFGQFFGIAFFLLLLIAALSSAISILEPVVRFVEQKTQLTRRISAWLMGIIIWLIGISALLAFNEWAEVKLFGRNIFDSLDFLTTNILLPLGGLGISLFATWVLASKSNILSSLGIGNLAYKIWYWLAAIVAPAVILMIAWNGLFIS